MIETGGTFRVNSVKNENLESLLLHSDRACVVSLEMCNCVAQQKSIFSQSMPALRKFIIVSNEHEHEEEISPGSRWKM